MSAINQAVQAALQAIGNIDDLEQALANRKQRRFEGFIEDVALAYVADKMGPGGRAAAADKASWSSQWITRQALLVEMDIPDELLTPELAPGVYWLILTSDLSHVAMLALLREAVGDGDRDMWSVADAKKAMGLQPERTRGATYRAQIAAHVGPSLTLQSEEFESARLERAAQVVVRVIK